MRIPSTLKVGKQDYEVRVVRNSPRAGTMGCISYDRGVIYVARYSSDDRRYSKRDMEDTFWHELTHAILKDMGHKLESDERFVTAFASLLTHAVNTAKFK